MSIPIRTVLNTSSIYEVRNKDTLDAVVDPTVNNDETEGYTQKSYWYNTVSGNMFICLDPTAGAAVWADTTLTLGDLGTAALNNTADFATAAQGALADTATQPGDLATVATSGAYSDLIGAPDVSGFLKVGNDIVYVETKADLPAPVGGVITLLADTTYMFGDIDLTGDRLVASANTAILGQSSEVSFIRSTGLNAAQPGEALISSAFTMPMRHLTLDGLNEGYPLLDLDALANPGSSLDWYGVNFLDAPVIGDIKDYGNVILISTAVLNSGELAFDGSIDTVAINNSLLVGRADGGGISTGRMRSTCTINRRLRITYSSVVTLAGGIGLNVESATTFPEAESAILDTVAFSGPGAPATATLAGTNKSLFINCSGTGVVNIPAIAEYYMSGNATATTIGTAGTFVKAAGVTTDEVSEKFTMSLNNELTYNGAFSAYVKVDIAASVSTGSNNQNVSMELRRDDGGGFTTVPGSIGSVRASTANQPYQLVAQCLVLLSPGDKISVYVTNDTATNAVTVENLSVIAVRAA